MTLRPVEFHILLALAADERHGYGILQEVAQPHATASCSWSRGRSTARSIACSRTAGWPSRHAGRPPTWTMSGAGYYRLTPLGRRVASAEAEPVVGGSSRVARANRLLTRA